ncbi:hypothetical protein TNCV_2845631 [Trichonephila clavipes]|nr:hypothetical protein TNCV_2845631 [Trichonephila clavipes]
MPDHHPDEPFYVRAVTELQDIEEAMTLAALTLTTSGRLKVQSKNENNPQWLENSASQNAPQTQLPPPIMLFVEKTTKPKMAAITKAFPKIRSRLTEQKITEFTEAVIDTHSHASRPIETDRRNFTPHNINQLIKIKRVYSVGLTMKGSCDRVNLYTFYPADKTFDLEMANLPTDMKLELAESQRNATRTPSPQLTPCEQLKYSKARLAKMETFRR